MQLFKSLSVLTILSVAIALPQAEVSTEAASPAEDAEDRFFGPGMFGGLVNANVNVPVVGRVGVSALGPNGVANVDANLLGGLVNANVDALGPNGIANVGVGVGGYPGYPGYPGGYPGYPGGYPGYPGGYPGYPGGYPGYPGYPGGYPGNPGGYYGRPPYGAY